MGFFDLFRQEKKVEAPKCVAVVPAAGSSTRMGEDKLFLPLNGVPVLIRTLKALEGCPSIDSILVVTRKDLLVPVSQLCKDAGLTKVTKVLVGGATRTESVLKGVREVSAETLLVAIHDGARPLVTTEVVEAAIARAVDAGAAAPAVAVKDTIKRAEGGKVLETPPRETLFAVQTPQVFETGLILGALEKAMEDDVSLTDDCAAVERLGMSVWLTEGSYENIKLTTPEDLAVAEGILARRENP